MKIGILSSLLYFITSAQCIAQLNVIADLGGISTAPFFEALSIDNSPSQSHIEPQPLIALDKEYGFPVTSKTLHPGKVTHRYVNLPGTQPFFILGHDALSMTWLEQRKTRLQQLNAVGFVTNLNHRAEFDAMQAIAPELVLQPLSVDDITTQLSIEAYPVLVTASVIEQ